MMETGVPFPIIPLDRPSSRKLTPSRRMLGNELISFPASPGSFPESRMVRSEWGGLAMPERWAAGGQWESTCQRLNPDLHKGSEAPPGHPDQEERVPRLSSGRLRYLQRN